VTETEISRVVKDVIVTILPHVDRAEIRGGQNLKDLGADSVERIEIILALKQRLSVDEPLSRFSSIADIDALIRFLFEVRSA
jgi:polyketide biosynthesis acyl carrier protein